MLPQVNYGGFKFRTRPTIPHFKWSLRGCSKGTTKQSLLWFLSELFLPEKVVGFTSQGETASVPAVSCSNRLVWWVGHEWVLMLKITLAHQVACLKMPSFNPPKPITISPTFPLRRGRVPIVRDGVGLFSQHIGGITRFD